MKKIILLFLPVVLSCTLSNHLQAQPRDDYDQKTVELNSTSFYYYETSTDSKYVVLLFHDWFGVSDLSFEIGDLLKKNGYNVIIMDLYKGKSATTNQEAGTLMNSIDQANVWNYIDQVVTMAYESYDKIIFWGFSLGTVAASNTAIKHHDVADGLILFYGNVTQEESQLAKITFPTLMVMGSEDNPARAIDFFNSVNKLSGTATLFIYPRAKHAFAQKLFNDGANYDIKAKEASLKVVSTFLSQIE
ncbi:hypothetical protein GTQ34_09695 [Muricauda sp. JGD-17]|uniref:Dienelactone hydrolase domain-containing protein n=1 Tax=Flagellimonas ochracea TaxID=2696472 RepID=A0A964TC79_9FLAO|nr:alpha/beta fold hydrolase [Allomuricauda ochracea]NAY92192.1 hypothetical protein [Allomuricauda ochracea]